MKKLAFLAAIYAILWIVVFILDNEASDKEGKHFHSAIAGLKSRDSNSKSLTKNTRSDLRVRNDESVRAIATTRQTGSQHQIDVEDNLRDVAVEGLDEGPANEAADFEKVVSPYERQGVLTKYYQRWQEQPDTPYWTDAVDKIIKKHIEEKDISLKDVSVSCRTTICRIIFVAEDVKDLVKLQSIPIIKNTVRTVGPLEMRPEGATVFVYAYNAPFDQ